MRSLFLLYCFVAWFSLQSTTIMAADPVKEGERIVFFGDSITQAGDRPGGYVQLVRETIQQQLPEKDIKVIGAGISGHKVPDLQKRLERDVLSKNPTKVVIYIGINDVWHSLRNRGTEKPAFEAGLQSLIQKINEAGAKVILCTPSVIGEKTDGSNQLDAMLEEYAAISRKVAADTNTQLLDLRKEFLDHLKKSNTENTTKGNLTGDGVHLNKAGNEFVAALMLDALGVKAEETKKMLRHVVLFQFKEGVSDAQIQEVVDAFAALPEKIDVIKDFEYGTDVSVENKAAGFTHCFFVTFENEAGRDIYLPHPDHKEFGKLVRPRLEKVLVFDYYVK